MKQSVNQVRMKTENHKERFITEEKSLLKEERSTLGIRYKDEILGELDSIYGAADALSMKNAKAYRRALALLSVAATFVTMAFLLYDEAELYWMILICGVMILFLFVVNRVAARLDCHDKYLEYRILAEAARVQFFVRFAGTKIRVSDIIPWPLQMNVPWVKEMLGSLMQKAVPMEKNSIRDCWIEEQRQYHISALERTQKKQQMNNRIVLVSLILSIAFYLFALFFEIHFAGLLGGTAHIDPGRAEFTRTVLKILLGTMSAATLFTGNYFGKLSLDNVQDDHRRMIALYDQAEQVMDAEGETDALILRLAREELNENSSWYSYQSVNTPSISM